MEKKLTLEDLAVYRPFGLKFIITSDLTEEFEFDEFYDDIGILKKGQIWQWAGEADNDLCIPILDGDLSMVFRNGFTWISIDYGLKPLLHPLSKLTQEIEHNREKFVPILKVLEILKIYPMSYNISENSIDLILDPRKHRANSRTKENRQVRFWFNSFNGIGFYCSNMKLLMYKDIYGAIKKLFEWHFDVFGLIENGLAIEKQ